MDYAKRQIARAKEYAAAGREANARDAAARALSELKPEAYPSVDSCLRTGGHSSILIFEAESLLSAIENAADIFRKGG